MRKYLLSLLGFLLCTLGIAAYILYEKDLQKTDDEYDWSLAFDANTVAGYKLYLFEHSDGEYHKEAQQRFSSLRDAEELAWKEAEKANTIDAFHEYIRRFPAEPRSHNAMLCASELAWKTINMKDIAQINSFLQTYPNSIHVSEAEKIKTAYYEEMAAWEKACSKNDRDAFSSFLVSYPQGAHANEAKSKLHIIIWDNAYKNKAPDLYREYISLYPQGIHAAEAKSELLKLDIEEWQKALKTMSPAGYALYLERFPDGIHSAEVRTAFNQLRKENEAREKAAAEAAEATAAAEARAAEQERQILANREAKYGRRPDPGTAETYTKIMLGMQLNDPDSVKYEGFSRVGFLDGQGWYVDCHFRAKNAFGGYVRNTVRLIKDGNGYHLEQLD